MDNLNTVVVGGGQAGLAVGYYLAKKQQPYIIFDDKQRTGDTWRSRWDSLRLFTPGFFNNLPGMPFPNQATYFPTKDEVADWLESYAGQFNLPIRRGVKVTRVEREDHQYIVEANGEKIQTKNVIVTTGAFHTPNVPSFSKNLDPGLQQLHSSEYHNPASIPGGSVLVVGAGNSGAEIAIELARQGKKVWMSGRDVGSIPADKFGRILGGKPYWWFLNHVLTIKTPIGRKMKSAVLTHGNPLIRTQRQDVSSAGVQLVPRISDIRDGKPVTENGMLLPAEAVIWATGFKPDFQWIRLPIFDSYGYPRHQQGVVAEAPGLYFVGLHFQSGLASSLIGGVGPDAKYVVDWIQ